MASYNNKHVIINPIATHASEHIDADLLIQSEHTFCWNNVDTSDRLASGNKSTNSAEN